MRETAEVETSRPGWIAGWLGPRALAGPKGGFSKVGDSGPRRRGRAPLEAKMSFY